jgi:prolipoprotein diacylglyceryltransferase
MNIACCCSGAAKFQLSAVFLQVCGLVTMFTLMSGFYKYMFQKEEFFVLILGLDNAGKTVSGFIFCSLICWHLFLRLTWSKQKQNSAKITKEWTCLKLPPQLVSIVSLQCILLCYLCTDWCSSCSWENWHRKCSLKFLGFRRSRGTASIMGQGLFRVHDCYLSAGIPL